MASGVDTLGSFHTRAHRWSVAAHPRASQTTVASPFASALRSLRHQTNATAMSADSVIHVHEDDWEMRNLYPLACRAEVAADMDDATAASERNLHPTGLGWTGVHVIKPPSTSYVDVNLLLSDAAAALSLIMPRVKRFYATIGSAINQPKRDPLGSYEEDAWSFGFGPYCYIKLEPEGDEHVERIWFDLRPTAEPEHIAGLKHALEAVDRLVPSLIADYFLDVVFPVGNAEQLDRYLAQLAHRGASGA
jgi:hypothetical protein